MGNRSKYVVVGSAAAGVAAAGALVTARRRARLGRAAEGFVDTIMPSVGDETPPTTPVVTGDAVHAPGHRHVSLTSAVKEERAPPPVRERPFAKHRRGLRHPGKG